MRSILRVGVAIGPLALLPLTNGMGFLHKRIVNDPVGLYLNKMCYPRSSNATWRAQYSANQLPFELGDSPYPCEQAAYIQAACRANGTEEIDFLAEQQCLCPSSMWTLMDACYECYFIHGFQRITPSEASSSVSHLSAAECTPTPPYQPYINLTPALNATSIRERPALTLGEDRFPNNTAVSNYFTPTGTAGFTLGEITGSATGRLRSWTDTDWERYTPTSTPTTTGTVASSQASSDTSSTDEGDSGSSGTVPGAGAGAATTTPASGNAAAVTTGGVRAYGCLLAAGLGAIALL